MYLRSQKGILDELWNEQKELLIALSSRTVGLIRA